MSVSPTAGVAVTRAGVPTVADGGGELGNGGRSVEVSVGWPGLALSTANWHHGDGAPLSVPSNPCTRHRTECPCGSGSAARSASYVCGGANPGVSGSATTAVPAVTSCHSNRATRASPESPSVRVARRRTPVAELTHGWPVVAPVQHAPVWELATVDNAAGSGVPGMELYLTISLFFPGSNFFHRSPALSP